MHAISFYFMIYNFVVGFDGKTVSQLKQRFQEAVDHYQWASKELGVEPQKAFSGKLLLRVPPELHARASVAAQVAGISLNQWAAKALEQTTQN